MNTPSRMQRSVHKISTDLYHSQSFALPSVCPSVKTSIDMSINPTSVSTTHSDMLELPSNSSTADIHSAISRISSTATHAVFSYAVSFPKGSTKRAYTRYSDSHQSPKRAIFDAKDLATFRSWWHARESSRAYSGLFITWQDNIAKKTLKELSHELYWHAWICTIVKDGEGANVLQIWDCDLENRKGKLLGAQRNLISFIKSKLRQLTVTVNGSGNPGQECLRRSLQFLFQIVHGDSRVESLT